MIDVRQAQAIIKQYTPQSKKQKFLLKDAFGYTLASDNYSKYDIPNFAQSSMDGYAIRFADKDQGLQIVGEIPAGSVEKCSLKNGTAYRIFTGAPLPSAADTVVMQEKVKITATGLLKIEDGDLIEGLHVRPVGSDAKKGTIAMRSGTYLSAAAIGYLAGLGHIEAEVHAPPNVSIILTGNELTVPGKDLAFGQVYESNSFQLESVLKQCGIRTIQTNLVKDDPLQLQKILESAIIDTDIILLVGGVSVGDYDYVIQVAEKCGVTQRFHKIKQKPGKPFYFGTKDDTLIFGLPGNPSSALTCFYVYIAPLLENMMQRPSIAKTIRASVTHAYKKKAGLTHFLKAFYKDGKVTPLHAQESYRLQSFAAANCLLVLDEVTEGCDPGDTVAVILIN